MNNGKTAVMYDYPPCVASAPQDEYSGVVLCIVIFLIFMLLCRGMHHRRHCAVYVDSDDDVPAAVVYAEQPAPDEPRTQARLPTHSPARPSTQVQWDSPPKTQMGFSSF